MMTSGMTSDVANNVSLFALSSYALMQVRINFLLDDKCIYAVSQILVPAQQQIPQMEIRVIEFFYVNSIDK